MAPIYNLARFSQIRNQVALQINCAIPGPVTKAATVQIQVSAQVWGQVGCHVSDQALMDTSR